MLEQLKKDVLAANLALVEHGLVTLTFGNASGIDRKRKLVVIKPSGVPYDRMKPSDMAVVDLNGKVVEGRLRPSSDTRTHLELYRKFDSIGGITHTHSAHATMFAQACRGIPCFGTTHADHFNGPVPVTRVLREEEVEHDYEANTGIVIIEQFHTLHPLEMPAVLVAHHGPFTWGTDAMDAVVNAVALEEIAVMALGSLELAPDLRPMPTYLLDKHFLRKHGPKAYYGQGRAKR